MGVFVVAWRSGVPIVVQSIAAEMWAPGRVIQRARGTRTRGVSGGPKPVSGGVDGGGGHWRVSVSGEERVRQEWNGKGGYEMGDKGTCEG